MEDREKDMLQRHSAATSFDYTHTHTNTHKHTHSQTHMTGQQWLSGQVVPEEFFLGFANIFDHMWSARIF